MFFFLLSPFGWSLIFISYLISVFEDVRVDKQGKLWQFFLLVKKQGVKSVGESNVIYHKASPDDPGGKKKLEAVDFL